MCSWEQSFFVSPRSDFLCIDTLCIFIQSTSGSTWFCAAHWVRHFLWSGSVRLIRLQLDFRNNRSKGPNSNWSLEKTKCCCSVTQTFTFSVFLIHCNFSLRRPPRRTFSVRKPKQVYNDWGPNCVRTKSFCFSNFVSLPSLGTTDRCLLSLSFLLAIGLFSSQIEQNRMVVTTACLTKYGFQPTN